MNMYNCDRNANEKLILKYNNISTSHNLQPYVMLSVLQHRKALCKLRINANNGYVKLAMKLNIKYILLTDATNIVQWGGGCSSAV